MRILGFIFAASIALAVLKVGLLVVLAVGLIVLVWLAVTRPVKTATGLTILIAYSFLTTHPLQALAAIVVLLAAAGILGKWPAA
jgi:hypothetical protein